MSNNTQLNTQLNIELNIEYMKYIFLGIISLTTLVCTFLLPYMFRKCEHYLHYMNGFSGSIMFSTALIHLIPELSEYQLSDYPFPFLFVIISFYIIMFIEKIIFHVHHHEVTVNVRNELISNLANVSAVGLHGIVAGINLGMSHDNETLIHMFVSIISHKIFASYAIGNKLFRSRSKLAIILPLILFNLMTPGGIIIGMYINNISLWLNMILSSIATGAFLYIGCADTLIDEIEMHHTHSDTKLCRKNPMNVSSINIQTHHNKFKLYLVQLLGVCVISSINIIYLYSNH